MEFTVYGEPRPKRRPRRNKAGAFYTPRETQDFEAQIAWEARLQRQQFGKREVIVYTSFYVASKQRPDGDNMHKAVLDALQKAEVYENDRQVIEGHYAIFPVETNPRTEIRVYAVDNTTTP